VRVARDRTRPWLVAATVAGLLGVGAVVASQVGAALGLSFTPARIPREDLTAAAPRGVVAAPDIAQIVAPNDLRVRLAARAVADALAGRGMARPAVVATPKPVRGAVLRVELGGDSVGPDEAYRLSRAGAGLVLRAAHPAGAATGLYAVADRIRSGDEVLPAGRNGKLTAPRLGLRLLDTGSVGLSADPADFVASDDYSLNTDVVGPAVLAGPPYVDGAAVRRIAAQFRQLVDHGLAEGYNAVVVPGFLEYVTFSGIGDGHQVYPAGDPHVARAKAMVAAFGPVWRYAHDAGMKVYFATDMLALSPPLQRYLENRFGGLATDDPRLWTVYRTGLRELFDKLPYAGGLVIRVGEGGSAYRFPGWDYTSKIAVRTPAAVRAMLRALLAVAGEGGRDVIFRTWTIGVGSIGDLHTNPRRYEQVLGGIDDPHLIVSTKYCLGDYYSYLPLNDTLEVGNQRRIVELQARREFEGMGSLPDDLTALHAKALRTLLKANPHIEGIWTWSQMGGPLRAGPRNLYLRAGFWQMYDVNVYTAARLAADPDADPARLTADWIRRTFSTDPSTVEAIGKVFALSRKAITKGLYIGPYARRTVKALGLEPPPMMWIFEWDIVSGDSAVLDSIYAVSRDHLDEAIREGDEATATARRMRDLLAATDPGTWRDPGQRKAFSAALDYEVDLLGTLAAYRTMVLRYAQWLDTGSSTARTQWQAARSRYVAARDEHLRRCTGDVDLPPYRFPAADIGLAHADRDLAMAWLSRVLLAILAAALALGTGAGQRLLRRLFRCRRAPGAAALRALWLGTTRPWRVGDLGPPPTTLDRVLVWALPVAAVVLSRAAYGWFASPVHLLVTVGGWAAFAGVLRILARGHRYQLAAALGGAALVRTLLLLAALAERGPGRYWYAFWTQPVERSVYITVAFAAFGWVPVAAYLALRSLGARFSAAPVLAAAGTPVALLGATVWAVGLETSLSAWNDQMALLPWGMHRILGITVFLDLPPWLPQLVTAAGATLLAAAGLTAAGRLAVRRNPG
jgi:glycosyl hydrolase family 67